MIARNAAFAYKGRPLDVKTIGRELNVRYVLEGSVLRGSRSPPVERRQMGQIDTTCHVGESCSFTPMTRAPN